MTRGVCDECGSPCSGRYCRICGPIERQENLDAGLTEAQKARVHHRHGPHRCDICSEDFATLKALREHDCALADGGQSAGGVGHDETEARRKRRERRFRCRARPAVKHSRRVVEEKVRDLREEERLARKRHHEEHAEEYRQAANALENALAEIEGYLGGDA